MILSCKRAVSKNLMTMQVFKRVNLLNKTKISSNTWYKTKILYQIITFYRSPIQIQTKEKQFKCKNRFKLLLQKEGYLLKLTPTKVMWVKNLKKVRSYQFNSNLIQEEKKVE